VCLCSHSINVQCHSVILLLLQYCSLNSQAETCIHFYIYYFIYVLRYLFNTSVKFNLNYILLKDEFTCPSCGKNRDFMNNINWIRYKEYCKKNIKSVKRTVSSYISTFLNLQNVMENFQNLNNQVSNFVIIFNLLKIFTFLNCNYCWLFKLIIYKNPVQNPFIVIC
jgi:hypothetical protein